MLCVPGISLQAEEIQSDEDRISGHLKKDLADWVVDGRETYKDKDGKEQPVWTFGDGILRCAGKGGGFLRYDKKLCDFEAHVEFRMTKGCNSGIGIRGVKFTGGLQTRPSFAEYEIQVLDDSGKNPHKHGSMSLYRYVAPTENAVKPYGEWNAVDITCRGSRIKVVMNGKTVHDIDQKDYPATKNKPLCGYLSLQDHGRKIEFRNVQLKELTNP